ncbi:MAG: hydroxymethylbilane synthase [Planctomycetes bacterium]|nr:hydroxymethylbilane synthase [Planctomycetota bacterium]MCH9727158.1 hydroxymethylbilane synthase [Planctomycetota bacterium]MCH9778551.1 hydroxymethylbilane synthase [Planctomycetota bacterium]MCH9791137.1 hydroxymethylbilane synthase [Planctomycetota bacterium]MDF1742667.1 hydroxymethylbilane synthase [Gimesia sp.]
MNQTSQERPLRIATRASRLALWQAHYVADLLKSHASERAIEIVHITSEGDRDLTSPLSEFGGLGVFTREVQKAVLDGRADLAVHSLKDLPTEQAPGLQLAGIPERGPLYDVLIFPKGSASVSSLSELPPDSRIGTGSLRRRAQLLHQRDDLQMQEVRGNVETRLKKLDAGEYDALCLAEAGMVRLDLLEHRTSLLLTPPEVYPAVGQGALGIECRDDDNETCSLLNEISHIPTKAATAAERSLLAFLRAGCHAPIGILSHIEKNEVRLDAVVLSGDGQELISASATGSFEDATEIGIKAAKKLLDAGAGRLISIADDS